MHNRGFQNRTPKKAFLTDLLSAKMTGWTHRQSTPPMNSSMDAHPPSHISEAHRHFRRNYLAHCLDGGFFMGGAAFLAADTVLTKVVLDLGGPNWLIALMPQMMMLGFVMPPILLAHRVESMHRLKPFIIVTGVLQRLPFLIAGLALLLAWRQHPTLVLILVAAAPFCSGLAGGVGFGAWIEMTSRLIPAARRSSATAWRCLSGAVIGLGAGEIIRAILAAHPGAAGYGRLHLISFGILTLSLISFSFYKEVTWPPPASGQGRGFLENLREMPALIRGDRAFRYFILVRICNLSLFVLTPFLSIHAVESSGRGAAFLGSLLQCQMAGIIVGNLFGGWAGDHFGGRLLIRWSQICFVVLAVGVVIGLGSLGCLAVFFLLGLGSAINLIGQSTLSIELSPDHRRPTYIAIMTAVLFPCGLLAAGASTLLHSVFSSVRPAGLVLLIGMIAAQYFIRQVAEPRLIRRAAALETVG